MLPKRLPLTRCEMQLLNKISDFENKINDLDDKMSAEITFLRTEISRCSFAIATDEGEGKFLSKVRGSYLSHAVTLQIKPCPINSPIPYPESWG